MATFRSLQWLFPLAVTLHNLEEAVWLPAFVAAHASELRWTVQLGVFRAALAVMTVAAWIITFLSWKRGPQSIWAYLLFGYIAAMLVNVFVPHVPAALMFGGYSPGLVTAVFVNLPVMTMLVIRALRERYVSGRKAVAFGVAVPVALVMLIPTVSVLGQ